MGLVAKSASMTAIFGSEGDNEDVQQELKFQNIYSQGKLVASFADIVFYTMLSILILMIRCRSKDESAFRRFDLKSVKICRIANINFKIKLLNSIYPIVFRQEHLSCGTASKFMVSYKAFAARELALFVVWAAPQ